MSKLTTLNLIAKKVLGGLAFRAVLFLTVVIAVISL